MNGIVFSGVCLLFLFTLSTADLCTDITDTNSELYRCNVELAQRSNSACEGDCRSTLEQYADDCLGAGAQTYKDSIDTLCDEDATTDSAGGMGPAVFSTASTLFFAVYAAFF